MERSAGELFCKLLKRYIYQTLSLQVHNFPSVPFWTTFIHSFNSLCVLVASVMSDSLRPYGLWPTRLLCPWDSQGKNTGVGCHALLHRLFPTQETELTSLTSPALAGGFFTTSTTCKVYSIVNYGPNTSQALGIWQWIRQILSINKWNRQSKANINQLIIKLLM